MVALCGGRACTPPPPPSPTGREQLLAAGQALAALLRCQEVAYAVVASSGAAGGRASNPLSMIALARLDTGRADTLVGRLSLLNAAALLPSLAHSRSEWSLKQWFGSSSGHLQAARVVFSTRCTWQAGPPTARRSMSHKFKSHAGTTPCLVANSGAPAPRECQVLAQQRHDGNGWPPIGHFFFFPAAGSVGNSTAVPALHGSFPLPRLPWDQDRCKGGYVLRASPGGASARHDDAPQTAEGGGARLDEPD